MPGSTNGNNFGLTKNGIGTFTLNPVTLVTSNGTTYTGNTYYGPTKILGGILSLANSTAMQNSPLDTLNSIAGDTTNGLQTTVTTLTMGGLTGNKNLAAVFTTTAGGYDTVTALTLNPGTGATPSYSGIIADGAAGMTLTKTGAGTKTLSGANTYTGGTTINGGILNVNADTALGAAAGAVAISNGATLQAGGAVTTAARTLTLGTGGGTIDTNGNAVTLDAGSTVTGTTLTKSGAGTLTLEGTQTYATLNADDGTVELDTAIGTGASTVNANSPGGVDFNASQTLAALNLDADGVAVITAGGDKVLDLGALTFAGLSPAPAPASPASPPPPVPEPGSALLALAGASACSPAAAAALSGSVQEQPSRLPVSRASSPCRPLSWEHRPGADATGSEDRVRFLGALRSTGFQPAHHILPLRASQLTSAFSCGTGACSAGVAPKERRLSKRRPRASRAAAHLLAGEVAAARRTDGGAWKHAVPWAPAASGVFAWRGRSRRRRQKRSRQVERRLPQGTAASQAPPSGFPRSSTPSSGRGRWPRRGGADGGAWKDAVPWAFRRVFPARPAMKSGGFRDKMPLDASD